MLAALRASVLLSLIRANIQIQNFVVFSTFHNLNFEGASSQMVFFFSFFALTNEGRVSSGCGNNSFTPPLSINVKIKCCSFKNLLAFRGLKDWYLF